MKINLSKRLSSIIDLIESDDVVLDVGTDHGIIPIYLVQHRNHPKVYASDISKKAISSLRTKVEKLGLKNKIILFNEDGLNNIKNFYNLIVISGLGFHTIKNIITNNILPKNLIIQTNSKEYELRKLLNQLSYKIERELIVLEKNKLYIIIKYKKGFERLSYFHLKFGKSNNKEYFYKKLQEEKLFLRKKAIFKKVQSFFNIVALKIKIHSLK